jgi:hypothetical protein
MSAAPTLEDFRARLSGVKSDGNGGLMALCPCHEDRTPSLHLWLDDKGLVAFDCKAGCDWQTVRDELGRLGLDVGQRSERSNGHGKILATYPYTDETGELLYEAVRFDPKDFRQRRPDGKGGWTWKLGDTRRVLYHLPRVVAAVKAGKKAIVVVEGEKDVEALEALGVVATTNAGGAGKWREEYTKAVAGAKLVVLLPDNDEPGREHAAKVAESLTRAGAPYVIVGLPGLAEKGDVSDWLAAGGTRDSLDTLVKKAMAEPASTEAIGDHIGGRVNWAAFWIRERVDEDWVFPDVLAKRRGHAIYGDRKDGKSLFNLWMAAKLATSQTGLVVSYLDYEMSEDDVHERLRDMGYGPETDLSRLHYHLWPHLATLDTEDGGVALMAGLDDDQADFPDAHPVAFIDTWGRAVDGPEDAADTVRAFYNHTGIKLKRRGATWNRIDHTGKDETKGQRGSSAKADDPDVIWWLVKTNSGAQLRRDFARMLWVPDRLTFTMAHDPLDFVRTGGDYPAGTAELANILNRLKVPLDASRAAASVALRTIDEGRRPELVMAALRYRRDSLQ